MSQVTSSLIEIRPSRVVGDRAFITGTRVSVEDIYIRHEICGQTADDIVGALPHLSLAQIHAALAYAYGHLEELRGQMKDGEAFVEQLKKITGPGPLAEKLSGLDQTRNEESSR